MERTGEGYRLSTGREFPANQGILGLAPGGTLTDGYDSIVEYDPPPDWWDDPESPHARFSAAERREIADYMISAWQQWAAEEGR